MKTAAAGNLRERNNAAQGIGKAQAEGIGLKDLRMGLEPAEHIVSYAYATANLINYSIEVPRNSW